MANRGQDTRQRIIECAAEVFNTHGYAGTAISELMEATGLRKGGIYRHFSSKEELAEEAFRYAWAKALVPRRKGVSECASSTGRLRCLVHNFVHNRPKGLAGGCPLMNTAIDADDTNPILFSAVQSALREWRDFIEEIVREGQRKGELRRDISPAIVATTLIGGLEGGLLISRIEQTRVPLLVAAKNLELFIRSLERNASPQHNAKRARRPERKILRRAKHKL
jgi:TetR/AcrR family transcriptional regulator, transcriptional repressor for nem operon